MLRMVAYPFRRGAMSSGALGRCPKPNEDGILGHGVEAYGSFEAPPRNHCLPISDYSGTWRRRDQPLGQRRVPSLLVAVHVCRCW